MSAQIFPVVGSSLSIANPLPTTDSADGVPGSPPPAIAIQVAGTDGTDLQVLKTDTNGRLVTVGNLTNNTAAPGAKNFGVLPAVANAAAPTLVEGDQVLLSTDLTGALRTTGTGAGGSTIVVGTLTNNNAAPAATEVGVLPAVANAVAPIWTEGDQVLLSEDLTGDLRVTAKQSGTWNIGNLTSISSPVTVTGTVGVTFPASPIVWIEGHAGAVLDAVTTAATAPTNGLSVLGVHNSVPALTDGQSFPLSLDTTGSLYVNATGRQATYRATQSAFAPLADPTVPFLVMQGSATKTVKLRHIKISWACTVGNAAPNVLRVRRYTAISGGTSTLLTPVPDDTNNAVATAVLSQYSVLPTTATPFNAGSLSSEYMQWTTNSASLVAPVAVQLDFALDNCQALTLRGVSDFFGIEITATATTGGTMTVRFTWTEE